MVLCPIRLYSHVCCRLEFAIKMNIGYTAITYVGKTPSFSARIGKAQYEFEWQNARGVGGRKGEVPLEHAKKLSRWRDKRGKRMFTLE